MPTGSGSGAALVDEATFAFVTDLEVKKAVRLQYYVSLLATHADAEDGKPIETPLVVSRRLALLISATIRSTDLVAVVATGPDVHALLVGTPLGSIPAVVERITRATDSNVFDIDGRRGFIGLSLGGACFPTTARNGDDLVRQAGAATTNAQRDRTGRHRYRLAAIPSDPPG